MKRMEKMSIVKVNKNQSNNLKINKIQKYSSIFKKMTMYKTDSQENLMNN